MPVLFILFIVIPLVEMLILIKVGGVIGALPTIALMCLTAAIGVGLIRAQGLSTMQRAQSKMANGEVPASEMLDGLCLVVGGAMLLTPGFFTDSLGFVLLIPGLRHLVFHKVLSKLLASKVMMQAGSMGGRGFQSGFSKADAPREEQERHVIDGEFRREDEK